MSLEKKDAIQGVKGAETVVKTRMGSSEHKQGWGHSFQGVLSVTKPHGRVSGCSQCQSCGRWLWTLLSDAVCVAG